MQSKLFVFLFFVFFGQKCLANAAAHNDLILDEKAIATELKDLNQVENFVLAHPDANLNQLQQENPAVFKKIALDNQVMKTFDHYEELPLGIPPFLWGCVFGIIGILLVYLMTDRDRGMTNRAVTGCLVGYGLIAIVYVIFFAAAGVR